jgi:hypothetical protein
LGVQSQLNFKKKKKMLHTEQPAFIFFHRNFPLAVIKFFFVD